MPEDAPSAVDDPAQRALELLIQAIRADPELGDELAASLAADLAEGLAGAELPSVQELLQRLGAP